MVPRTENGLDVAFALKAALEEAGVECGLPGGGVVQIAREEFHLMPIQVVRDRDAMLIAHLQTRPPTRLNGNVVGSGKNDAEILWRSLEREGRPTVVVANRISELAREELSRAEVAWLDRRGHLWVRTANVYVNADVSPSVAPPARVVEVMSGTGLDVAIALLVAPEEDAGVNELARRIRRSPGRVSEILGALRVEGLIEGGNRPAVPELFWHLADKWKPQWRTLSSIPPLEFPDRYRLTGTLAGLKLGAPMAAGPQGSPLSLYVAKTTELSGLVSAYGLGGATMAEAAVCPSRFAMSLSADATREGFPLAHQVVVALDLAQDRARGREMLESWQPVGAPRVW